MNTLETGYPSNRSLQSVPFFLRVEMLNVLYILEALRQNHMPGLLPGWTREDIEQLPIFFFFRLRVQMLNVLYQAMQTQEKKFKNVFYCFYKTTFPRKNAKLFVWHRLKEKFLPVVKSCPRSLARVIGSCFAKRCFPKYEFFLKMSA